MEAPKYGPSRLPFIMRHRPTSYVNRFASEAVFVEMGEPACVVGGLAAHAGSNDAGGHLKRRLCRMYFRRYATAMRRRGALQDVAGFSWTGTRPNVVSVSV
jgi:hypothetical protein